jgi:hypothetical protein
MHNKKTLIPSFLLELTRKWKKEASGDCVPNSDGHPLSRRKALFEGFPHLLAAGRR